MIKKIIIGLIAITGIAAIIYFFSLIEKEAKPNFDFNKAIPIDAAFIIESKNLPTLIDNLHHKNKIWAQLSKTSVLNNLDSMLYYPDSIFSKDQVLKKSFENKPFGISAHKIGKSTRYLLYFSVKEFADIDELSEKLKPYFNNAAFTKREYSSQYIYDVKLNKNILLSSFSFTMVNNIFIFSKSSILIENAIRQLKSDVNILSNNQFKLIKESAGTNVDFNLYINYKEIPKLFNSILNKDYIKSAELFNTFASWTELDANIKNNSIMLNGYTNIGDSTSNYLSVFKSQDAGSSDLIQFFPANTSSFLLVSITDKEAFQKDYQTYLQESYKDKLHQKYINIIENKTGNKADEFIFNILEDEIAVVYTDINQANLNQFSYVVLKTIGRSKTEEHIQEYLMNLSDKKSSKIDALIQTVSIDNQTQFQVYNMGTSKIFKTLFGEAFSSCKAQYAGFIDNNLVFGSSPAALKKFMHYNVLKKVLSEDKYYKNFSEYLSNKANIYLYSNIARSSSLYKNYLNSNKRKSFDSEQEIWQKFQAFGIQITNNDKMMFTDAYFNYNPVFKEKPRTVWESRLDTNFDMKPRLVKNHYTDEKEIIIQDLANKLYLISQSGRIIWKIQLKEPIIGEIRQIDYFKNGKLQIVFNTKSQIHILDRLGNYVERYPINLRAPATNGMSVFDYDNSRDYRLLIACEDKNVYMYDIEGNIIKGWEFKGTEYHVNGEIQHFRHKTKDYIVFADERNVYILNRRGEVRVEPEKQFSKSQNNSFTFSADKNDDKSAWVCTDTSGTVYFINLKGKVKSYNIKNYSANHYFNYVRLTDKKTKDFIFIDNNQLEVYNFKETVFSYEFEDDIEDPASIYYFPGGQRKIGIVSKQENRIFLFNSDGSIYSGFPLIGRTMFSIGYMSKNTGNFNLVVGSSDNFIYNYEVQ